MRSRHTRPLTQPGTPDPGFGEKGQKTLYSILKKKPELTDRFRLKGLATDNDGKLLFSANLYTTKTDSYIYGLGRLNVDGSLDKTFAENALVLGDFVPSLPAGGSRLAVQTDGKILMLGWTSRSPSDDWADLVIARFDRKGRLDTSFAEQGQRILQTGPDVGLTEDSATLHVQPDGRILVSVNYSKRHDAQLTESVLFRLRPDGALDTTLNGTGQLDFKPGVPNASTAIHACISQGTDHQIVLVGHARFIPDAQTAFFARLNPDGSTDLRFGNPLTPGYHYLDKNVGDTTLYDLVEREDKSLVGAGQVGLTGHGTTKGLIRAITANGTEHKLFNNGEPLISQFEDGYDVSWRRIMSTSTGYLTTASPGTWIYIAQFKADGTLNSGFNEKGFTHVDSPVMSTPLLLTERSDQRVIVGANVAGTDPVGGVGLLVCLFG